jgi:hypothetical protein
MIRVRHYGFIANVRRKDNFTRARELLAVEELILDPMLPLSKEIVVEQCSRFYCPGCGNPMVTH